jgi:hypothetical protein
MSRVETSSTAQKTQQLARNEHTKASSKDDYITEDICKDTADTNTLISWSAFPPQYKTCRYGTKQELDVLVLLVQ